MKWKHPLVLLLLAPLCHGQFCELEGQGKPESAYDYVRAEAKALQWIRDGLTESEKIQFSLSSPNDPQTFHKSVEFYTVVENVDRDYDCAVSIISKYKDSKNDHIHTSVESFLTSLQVTKDISKMVVGMLENINKAKKPEDVDLTENAKTLAELKGLRKDAMFLAMGAVKMSTFTFIRTEGEGEETKPVAFTIPNKQRATLQTEVEELMKKKGKGERTYVDYCADILLSALKKPLPTSSE